MIESEYLSELRAQLKRETGIEFEISDEKIENPIVQKDGKTFFIYTWNKRELVGVMEGDTQVQYNYALFLSYLIQNSDSATNISQEEFFRNIVLGSVERQDILKYIVRYDIPRDKPCYALAVKTDEVEEVATFLSANKAKHDYCAPIDEHGVAFLIFPAEGDLSPREYALYLVGAIKDELGISVRIGVGNIVKNFFEAPITNAQAGTALRLSEILESKYAVHTYRGYTLVKLLEDIPAQSVRRYAEKYFAESKTIFADDEILNTVEVFCQNSLNISETAKALYLHRNTLVYRLDQIEKETGLNIRKFSDAMTFRVLSILYKLNKS